MFNRIQILYVIGWNMLKFGCSLSLCMKIPPSDDKYWATNLYRVQEIFLVFRMFFWCYNNVTRDLLCTAVSFNLVYLASMSILDTPPGATLKMKSWSLPSFMEIQCKQLWAEPWEGHVYKYERISELSQSDYSVSGRDKMKCRCAQLLAASIHGACQPDANHHLNSRIPSPCQQALIEVMALLQVKQDADIGRSREWDHPATQVPLQPAESPTFSQWPLCLWSPWAFESLGVELPFRWGSLVANEKNSHFSAYAVLNYFGRKRLNTSPPPFYVIFLYHWVK